MFEPAAGRRGATAMRLRTSLGFYRATLWSALGVAPLSACGGDAISRSGANDGASGSTGPSAGFGGQPFATGGVIGSSGAPIDARIVSGGVPNDASIGSGGVPNDARIGSGGAPQIVCKNPQPVLAANQKPTGLVSCDHQPTTVHRVARVDCPSTLPRPASGFCTAGAPSECASDADCKARPYGICQGQFWGPPSTICNCSYGCVRDSDCASGEICLCGDIIGQCVRASCATDSDCGGLLCVSYVATPPGAICDTVAMSCQTPTDQCTTSTDCPPLSSPCVPMADGRHVCSQSQCGYGGVGRPFLVEGAARLAPFVERADWASSLAPRMGSLTERARAELARRWTDMALMEHASIAANARFALELLSLGAPADLVRCAQEAMADEAVHARDAFALASAYAGRSVGPGPLEVTGALTDLSPLDIIRRAILEGCIGETVAAVEAAEALAFAEDQAVRAALERAAADEIRHAELVWRFVRWMLDGSPPELREPVVASMASTVEAVRSATIVEPEHGASHGELRAHGILDSGARAEIRRRVLAEVVMPCVDALLGEFGSRRRHRGLGATTAA